MKKFLVITTVLSSILCMASLAALVIMYKRNKEHDDDILELIPDVCDCSEVRVVFAENPN